MAKRATRRPRCAEILCLFLAVALWPLSAALGQDCEIKLHRPSKVGDKQHVSVVVRRVGKQVAKRDGQVLPGEGWPGEDYRLECEGTATVLEVDEKDQTVKFSLAVEKCTRTEGADSAKDNTEVEPATEKPAVSELAPKGANAVFSLAGEIETVEINGQPPPRAVVRDLRLLFPLARNMTTADEAFGAAERKKVGDEWAGDPATSAQFLRKLGAEVAKKQTIASTVRLEKLAKVGEMNCLQVNCAIEAKLPAPEVLDNGVKMEKFDIKARYTGKFPLDIKATVPESSFDVTYTYVARMNPDGPGPETMIEVSFTSSRVERRSDVK